MASGNSLTGLVRHLRRSCGDGPADGDLLAEFAANRDEGAFAELVARHGGLVFGVARRHVPDRQAAEDVVQATFLALARNASCLGRPPSLVNWLYTVALRQARKARLRFARRAALLNDMPPPTNPVDPLAQVSGRELVTIIDDELARLPEPYRLPILLCALEGLSREEAARRLGWPTGSVKGRLERGRELLRTRLAKRGLTVPAVLAGGLLSTPSEAMPATLVAAVTRAAVALPLGGASKLLLIAGLVLMAASVGAGVALTPGGQPGPKPGVQIPMAAVSQPRVDAEGVPLPPGVLARLGSSRMRHAGWIIRAVALSPNGRTVASADTAGTLCVWDAHSGKRLQTREIRGNEMPGANLMAIAFDADSREVHCVASADKVARIYSYDLPSGREIRRIDVRGEGYLNRAVLAHNGRLVASAWTDSFIRINDVLTGHELWNLRIGGDGVTQMAFSTDGRTLAVADCREVLTFHDVANGRPVRELKLPDHRICLVSLSGDGRSAITTAYKERGTEIQLWDLPAGKVRRCVSTTDIGIPTFVAFSPDNRLAVTSSVSGPCIVLDAETGNEVRRFKNFFGGIAAAFSNDGRTLVIGSNTGTVTLWDMESGGLRPASADPPVYVGRIGFAAGGGQLLGLAGKPVAWNVTSGIRIERFAELPSYGAVLSPDGQTLAVPAEPARLYDTGTGRESRGIRLPKTYPSVMSFTPDGRRLVCATTSGQIQVFDVASGTNVATLDGHSNQLNWLATSSDGRWLASSSTDGSARGHYEVHLWDLTTSKELRRLTPRRGSVFAGAFSSDGRRLVTVGGEPGRPNDRGEVQMWDLQSGREIRSFEGHTERVTCVVFAPDGMTIATGSLDHTFRLWETATGKEKHRFIGHKGSVQSIAFSPDGRTVAASSPDAPVYLWDVYGRSDLQRPPSADELAQCWTDLAGTDAAVGFRAVRRLIVAPDAAVSLLRGRLTPALPVNAERITQLVEMLDSPNFADRQTAAKELDAVADRAADQLRAALTKTKSAEVRHSLQAILDRVDAASPEILRAIRAVEVLEQIGTPAAREHLRALAGGAAGATLTRAASEALTRLSK